MSKNRLQWVLSGTLSAGLALAPALVASAQQAAQSTPGQQGNWGQAGPPPDVQDGKVPPPDSATQDQNQSPDQGPSQYPGMTNQDSNQGSATPPAGAGVGYGQAPRPAYQPGQNQSTGQNQGYQQAAPPSGPVTLASGLLLPIRISEPLDSKRVQPGDYFQGNVAQSIYVGNVLAIPRGAAVTGRVVDVKKAGELKGGASMALQLTTLNLGGNSYSLASDIFNTSSPGKGGYTAGNTVGAAALGAAIGAIAGGGPGAAIGAVAGTGVGLGASAATPGPRSVLPPEALLTFHLTSPATVQPVSSQEAARLQGNAGPQGRRYPPSPYGAPAAAYAPPPPGYAPYPYAYGYPYPYRYAYPYPYVYGYPYYYRRWR